MDEIHASNVYRDHANHQLALSEGSLIKLFYNDTAYFLLWLNFKATSFAECHGAAALGRSSMEILKIHIIIRRTQWLCNGYESNFEVLTSRIFHGCRPKERKIFWTNMPQLKKVCYYTINVDVSTHRYWPHKSLQWLTSMAVRAGDIRSG